MRVAVGMLAATCLLGGCRHPAPPAREEGATAQLFLETRAGDGHHVTLPQSGLDVTIEPEPILTRQDFVHVSVAQFELGRGLLFVLAEEAAERLATAARSDGIRRGVLFVKGEPIALRRIEGTYADRRLFMFVERPEAELSSIAADLSRPMTLRRPNAK